MAIARRFCGDLHKRSGMIDTDLQLACLRISRLRAHIQPSGSDESCAPPYAALLPPRFLGEFSEWR